MKKLFAVFLTLTILFQFTISTSAESNYLYDIENNIIPAPPAAYATQVIDNNTMGVTALNQPQDFCIDAQNNVFIADTQNNRVLILDSNFTIKKEIVNFASKQNSNDSFSEPHGVFVDDNNILYVADTSNARIVLFDIEGNFINILPEPKSKLLTSSFNYKPTKIAVDHAGRIFVISSGFNMGIIELTQQGDFVQMLGAPKTTYTLSEMFWRLFSTKEQRERMVSFVPTEYSNLYVDSEDFIFATPSTGGSDEESQLKTIARLNAKGTDVLNESDSLIGDIQYETFGTVKGPSLMVDIVALNNGVFASLDQKRGRVFVYNSDGELLFLFGDIGEKSATFRIPTAIAFNNNCFYILDSSKATITQFKLTEYGLMLLQTQQYKEENDFEKEKTAWESILKYNENNPVVLREMGKIAYKQHDMTTAMKYFKEANEKTYYSKAFQFYRREVIQKYFTPALIVLCLLICIILFLKHIIKKRRAMISDNQKKHPIIFLRHLLIHPLDGFWDLRYENRGNTKLATSLLILTCLSFIIHTQFTAFAFNSVNPQNVSFLYDIAKVILPFFLWIISSWCVTSLMDGEGNIRHIYVASCYSLTPFVILVPLATVISNVLTLQEKELYTLLIAIAFVWAVALLLVSVKQTHNYSGTKTVGVVLISLLAILIIVFIALLCFALIQQMYAFVADSISELSLRI